MAKAFEGKFRMGTIDNDQTTDEENGSGEDDFPPTTIYNKRARRNIFQKYRTDKESLPDIQEEEGVMKETDSQAQPVQERKRKFKALVSPMRNKVTTIVEPSTSMSSEPCDEGRTDVLFR